MATKIVTKNSSTASAVPTASDLVQGELAVNVADKRLFTEDNGGAIVELGTNPSSLTVSGNIDVDGTTNLDVVDIDGAVDMASTLTVTGEIIANGGIALGDNDKATFGASDDLQIYHDGNDSYIDDAGQGSLAIRGSASVSLQNYAGGVMVKGNAGSDTILYHNNVAKLATTSTGIDITGQASMDGLTVDGAAVINYSVATNSLAAFESGAGVYTYTSGGVGVLASYSSGATKGILKLDTSDLQVANGSQKLITTDSNGDISFYEDTGTTPKFFWDASAESLGIGTSSPSSILSTSGTDATTYSSSSVGGQDSSATLKIQNLTTSANTFASIDFNTNNNRVVNRIVSSHGSTTTDGFLAFVTEGSGTPAERLRIDSSGNVGIGTSSPTSYADRTLHVTGGTGSATLKLSSTSAGNTNADGFDVAHSGVNAYLINRENGPMMFSTNDTERMRIDSSGNVGIGTSSPATLAHLYADNATLTIQDSNNFTDTRIKFLNGSSSIMGQVVAPSDAAGLEFYYGTLEAMRIDSSGLVTVKGSGAGSVSDHFRIESSDTESKLAFVNTTGSGAITQSGGDMRFMTNTANTERMRIDSSGNVGIGTSSPQEPLDIADGRMRLGNTKIEHSGSGGSWDMLFKTYSGGYFERMRLDSSGNLLVGTTDPSSSGATGIKLKPDDGGANNPIVAISTAGYQSEVAFSLYSTAVAAWRFFVQSNGTISAVNTTITSLSDQRVKENVRDLDDGLAKVMQLQPRKFDWKEGKGKDISDDRGFIAQEFEQVFPDMISEWKDEAPEGEEAYKAINANLIPTLVKAIQEQQTLIETLTTRVAALEE